MADMAQHSRDSVTLRPGVEMPDWSAVASPRAEEALAAIVKLFRFADGFADYSARENLVRRTTIALYGASGRAPSSVDRSSPGGSHYRRFLASYTRSWLPAHHDAPSQAAAVGSGGGVGSSTGCSGVACSLPSGEGCSTGGAECSSAGGWDPVSDDVWSSCRESLEGLLGDRSSAIDRTSILG